MCGLDESNGKIALSDTFFITGNMQRRKLQMGLEEHTGEPCFADDPQYPSILQSRAFSVAGMKAVCIGFFHGENLRAIEFHMQNDAAVQQREALFSLIGAQDPCADKMNSVLMRYPFGTARIAADPRSGDASLRITYTLKE